MSGSQGVFRSITFHLAWDTKQICLSAAAEASSIQPWHPSISCLMCYITTQAQNCSHQPSKPLLPAVPTKPHAEPALLFPLEPGGAQTDAQPAAVCLKITSSICRLQGPGQTVLPCNPINSSVLLFLFPTSKKPFR